MVYDTVIMALHIHGCTEQMRSQIKLMSYLKTRVSLVVQGATETLAQQGQLKELLAMDSILTFVARKAQMSEGCCAIGGDGHLFRGTIKIRKECEGHVPPPCPHPPASLAHFF